MNLKNIYAAGLLSFAVIGGSAVTSTPAQAAHQFGHAILGGIIGGVIGGAIVNRNNNYYNDRRPNDYGVQTYQQPRQRNPVYVQQRQRCWWENNAYIDRYGRQRVKRVQICS
jgi:hypothetical protein